MQAETVEKTSIQSRVDRRESRISHIIVEELPPDKYEPCNIL